MTNLNRALAIGAIAGPMLFTVAWAGLGLVSRGFTMFGTHIAPYSPIAHPISGLGLGVTAPLMNAAFVFGGVLLMVGAFGVVRSIPTLSRRTRIVCGGLLMLCGLGMVLDGIFTLESFLLHFIGFGIGVASACVTLPLVGRALRRVPGYGALAKGLLWAGPLTFALLVISQVTFDPVAAGAGEGIGGLTQRLLVLEVHAWFVALGWLALRRPREAVLARPRAGHGELA